MTEKQKATLDLDKVAADWNINAEQSAPRERRIKTKADAVEAVTNTSGEKTLAQKLKLGAAVVAAVVITPLAATELANLRGDQEKAPWDHTTTQTTPTTTTNPNLSGIGTAVKYTAPNPGN